jgi:4-methylaminobutanoate oxidase (formaldehyde-forming)
MGSLVAEWIVEGQPAFDVWHMDSRRFGRQYATREYTLARTTEVYSTYYDVKYPGQERLAGRPLRVSPTYPRLQELGAVWGEKSGWERVNWFERNAGEGDPSLRPRGWAGEIWSPAIAAEHRACRERVAIFDETSFSKIDVIGPGAAAFMRRMCTGRIGERPESVAYTQMLNARGGIECDVTVATIDEEWFRVVTGTAFGRHDLSWLRGHAPADGSVQITDVTSALACIGVWGPRSRDVLQPLTQDDLSNEAFPYMATRPIAVGPVPCQAARVTYVGELGWELYCPMEYGLRLWDAVWEAGRSAGLVPGGYRAIDSLRLEKGYRAWGADLTPDETPDEAGVAFAVRDGDDDFIGREALLASRRAGGPSRRLACLVLDDPRSVALGEEPVRVGGDLAGRVTSGGFGYSVERSIAYAYLPSEVAAPETAVEVEIFGRWVPGAVAAEPLFDPKGERIRA